MSILSITYRSPSELKPRARNSRTHSKRQLDQLKKSLREFGFLVPVLVDAEDEIIVGHARVAVACKERIAAVPVVRVDHLTPAQIRAYVIADNKIAENAGWDRELLRLELQELEALDIDLSVLAFDAGEIDVILQGVSDGGIGDADELPPDVRQKPPVSRRGDLWKIGPHRILCGDATDPGDFDRLLDGRKAQCVFTDPPYNVPIDGHVCGLGRTKHPEFAMAVGEMSPDAFKEFLRSTCCLLASHTVNGSIHFIFMDWRHIREISEAGAAAYAELKNICVWAKTSGGMGSLYRSQHEFVFVFKNGTEPHINNVELGKHGRNRTNVWQYAGVNTFGSSRQDDLAMHPTVKPVAMVSDALLDCSRRGGLILDPFAGSGTTLVSAQRTGRQGYGMEIDPYYVDTIVRRFKNLFGMEAVRACDGQAFEEASYSAGSSGLVNGLPNGGDTPSGLGARVDK